jgi:Amt family ammonium transporter
VAERIKLWPFLIFTAILTGVLYPISGSWQWGGGWLSEAGFSDFAGSTHRSLGRRLGCSRRRHHHGRTQGQVRPRRQGQPDAGFVDGSRHARHLHPVARLVRLQRRIAACHGHNGDVSDISRIFANTNLAAAGGVVAAIILTQVMYKKVDVTMALNGALAGLVSITAEPLMPSPLSAILIGAVGGVIVVFTVPMLDKFKIDDVVGAIPVHLLPVSGAQWLFRSPTMVPPSVPSSWVLLPMVSSPSWCRVSSGSSSRSTIGIRADRRRRNDGHGHGRSRCRSLSGIHQGVILRPG